MTTEEEKNKELARRFVEAQAKGDLDAVDQMLAPDFVNHNILVPGQEPDRESYKRGISAYKAALSPGRLIIEDQVAGGDKVVTRILAYATHDRGELMGVAPSGRELTNRGIEIHRIVEGKIAEEWGMGTLATKLRGQRLEQERIERERIEQELRVARASSTPPSPRRCPNWRVGRSPPTTSQPERLGETSTTSTSSLRASSASSWGTQPARACPRHL